MTGCFFIYLLVCTKQVWKAVILDRPHLWFCLQMTFFSFFFFCYLISGWRKTWQVCVWVSVSISVLVKASVWIINTHYSCTTHCECVYVWLFSVDTMLKFFIVCVICPSAVSPTLWPPERVSPEGRVWLPTTSMLGLTELSGKKGRKHLNYCNWKMTKSVLQQYCETLSMQK